MPSNPQPELDATDHAIVAQLQRDGRTSVAGLARVVNLSPSRPPNGCDDSRTPA